MTAVISKSIRGRDVAIVGGVAVDVDDSVDGGVIAIIILVDPVRIGKC